MIFNFACVRGRSFLHKSIVDATITISILIESIRKAPKSNHRRGVGSRAKKGPSPDVVMRTLKRQLHSASGHSIAENQRRVVALSRRSPSTPISRR